MGYPKKNIPHFNQKNFATLLALLHAKGSSAIFSLDVEVDPKSPDRNAIYISQAGLGLPSKEYYTEEKYRPILKTYEEVVAELLEMIMKHIRRDKDWKLVASEIIRFEKQLASVSWPAYVSL